MRALRIAVVAIVAILGSWSTAESIQTPTENDAIGKWLSVEQFEGEPRFAFSFKRTLGCASKPRCPKTKARWAGNCGR